MLESTKKQLFNFSDCSIINCIYAGALLKYKNNIEKSIKSISSVFNISSNVLVNSNLKGICTVLELMVKSLKQKRILLKLDLMKKLMKFIC